MDFPTHNTTGKQARTNPDMQLLRTALAVAVSVEPSSVICHGGESWAAEPIGRARAVGHRHPGKLHCHPYAEICLVLTGRAVFDLEDDRYSFSPPAMAVILPGVVHCEGYAQRNHKYSLLWASCSGPAFLAMVSSYHPKTGWLCPHRWSLRSSLVASLSGKLLGAEKEMGQELFEAVRADLVAIFGDLYHRAFNRQTHPRGRSERHAPMLQNLCIFIENHLDNALTLQDLASLTLMTPNYLNSLFVRWAGQPIHRYIVCRRMEKAMHLLRTSDLLVKQVARQVGYDDPLYFSRAFHRYYGRWPSEVR